MKNILAVAQKELIHILRDVRVLYIALAYPAFVLILFGFALKFDIDNISFGVCDFDRTYDSRRLVTAFENSGFFVKHKDVKSIIESEEMLRRGKLSMVLVIKEGFREKLIRGESPEVGLIVDGADNNSANQVRGYANSIIEAYSQKALRKYFISAAMQAPKDTRPVEIASRFYYNENLDSRHFFVPGLLAIIILVVTTMLTSLTIVKEHEVGTIESLLASPLKRYEILIGKIIPYCGIAIANLLTVVAVAFIVFDMPFRGNAVEFAIVCFLFLLLALSLGILISSITRSQQVAWLLSLLGTMLPSFLLSGYIFPIELMPRWMQYITMLVPARYFLPVIRGIILKGTDITNLLGNVIPLFVLAVLCFIVSLIKFKKVIE
ncbi:MAG: ABC transporter permease [Candidatus Schekmanbacteria bacterium]|nr:ABC transporter permease [Candidatus Schekmanbacteria bacterium]